MVTVAITCLACGSQSSGTSATGSAPPRAASASPFVIGQEEFSIMNAVAAGNDDYLAVAHSLVTGRGGAARVEVAKTEDGVHWAELPPPPLRLGGDGRIALVSLPAGPCIGAASRRITVQCHEGGAWVDRSPRLPPSAFLMGMTVIEQQPWALIGSGRQRVKVLRLVADGWTPVGQDLRADVAAFGTGSMPSIGTQLSRGRNAERAIWRLDGQRWRKAGDLPRRRHGPLVSGPVVSRSSALFAVTEASGRSWKLEVLAGWGRAWRSTGGPVNRGKGSAQGVVQRAGGRDFVFWQQHAPRAKGGFDAAVYLAELKSGRVAAPVRLWSGRSIGPADLQVLDALGRTWILYGRGRATKDPRLEFVIEPRR